MSRAERKRRAAPRAARRSRAESLRKRRAAPRAARRSRAESPRKRRTAPRGASGFTLFEVLGAVALLAFVYTTLAGVAITGVRSEGRSHRRLEASLLADWELAELEAQIESGIVPEVGTAEAEHDPFVVSVDVTPFENPIPETETGEPSALEPLFGDPDYDESPVLQITLSVSWFEGQDELRVTRTTWAIDPAIAQTVVQQLGGSGATPGTAPTTPTPSGAGDDPQ